MKLKSGNNKNNFQDIPAGYNLIKKHETSHIFIMFANNSL